MLISIAIPCFNEEEALNKTHERLVKILDRLDGLDFEIIYVDDGSSDETPAILRALHNSQKRVRFIRFSRNFGKEMALTAGLEHAAGDAVVFMDADLQDPPELIPEMVARWREGYNVVYGVRTERPGETRIKRWTAKLFYRLINHITEITMPLDAGDFRLMDRTVVNAILRMPERSRYTRGMISWAGFQQTAVYFKRAPRVEGRTKYYFSTMLRLALDGLISFSVVPLKLVTLMGFIVFFMSLAGILYALILRVFTDIWVTGWTALFIAILFIGGVQLLSLGIIGEYIGRIYGETKKRPHYIIEDSAGFNEQP